MVEVASVRPSRRLSTSEQKVCVESMLFCGVGPRGLCQAAAARTELRWARPHWSEIRGPRTLVAHAALSGRARGIALGRLVFLDMAVCHPREEPSLELLAHEVTHVAQYLREGTSTFLARYVSAYFRHRRRGLSAHAAYLAIDYEREARAVACRATVLLAGS